MVDPYREAAEIERLKGDFFRQSLEEEMIIASETRSTVEELQAALGKFHAQYVHEFAVCKYNRRMAQYQCAVAEEVCREARLLCAQAQKALQLYREQQHMFINRNKT